MMEEPIKKYEYETKLANSTNPTLCENLDAKIKYHLEQIEQLKQLKQSLPNEILNTNVRDLRRAMIYL